MSTAVTFCSAPARRDAGGGAALRRSAARDLGRAQHHRQFRVGEVREAGDSAGIARGGHEHQGVRREDLARSRAGSPTLSMFASSADANTSARAPSMSCLASVLDPS